MPQTQQVYKQKYLRSWTASRQRVIWCLTAKHQIPVSVLNNRAACERTRVTPSTDFTRVLWFLARHVSSVALQVTPPGPPGYNKRAGEQRKDK